MDSRHVPSGAPIDRLFLLLDTDPSGFNWFRSVRPYEKPSSFKVPRFFLLCRASVWLLISDFDDRLFDISIIYHLNNFYIFFVDVMTAEFCNFKRFSITSFIQYIYRCASLLIHISLTSRRTTEEFSSTLKPLLSIVQYANKQQLLVTGCRRIVIIAACLLHSAIWIAKNVISKL